MFVLGKDLGRYFKAGHDIRRDQEWKDLLKVGNPNIILDRYDVTQENKEHLGNDFYFLTSGHRHVALYVRTIKFERFLINEEWWSSLFPLQLFLRTDADAPYLGETIGYEDFDHGRRLLDIRTFDRSAVVRHYSYDIVYPDGKRIVMDVFFHHGDVGAECYIIMSLFDKDVVSNRHPGADRVKPVVQGMKRGCMEDVETLLHTMMKDPEAYLHFGPKLAVTPRERIGLTETNPHRPHWLLARRNQEPEKPGWARELKVLLSCASHRCVRWDCKAGLPLVLNAK
jgi:hypothetical protein